MSLGAYLRSLREAKGGSLEDIRRAIDRRFGT